MIRLLALLCTFSAPAFGLGPWEADLKVKFGLNPFDAFFGVPRSQADAQNKGWVSLTPPKLPDGYSELLLWCSETDYTVCIFTDETSDVAGLQLAYPKSSFEPKFGLDQGLVLWTTTFGGKTTEYYCLHQFYVSTDPAKRIASKDPSKIIRDGNLWLSGLGTLHNVSTTVSDFTDGNSIYTEQSCMPFMGHHYYYNMTKSLDCEKPLFPWFPLVHSNQLIGTGAMVFGKLGPAENGIMDFEHPSSKDVELIVPTGPQCLYDLAADPGVLTLHIYYINLPQLMFCGLE